MTAPPRAVVALLLLGVVALVIFPLFAERFYVQLVTRVMILAIFALSLDLLVGHTGLVSFGHAAFFGLSGYVLAVLGRDAGIVSLWLTLPICLAATALAALVIGWFSVRTSGVYFIMITLAFAQMLHFAFNDSQLFGGSDGMFIDTKPEAFLGAIELFTLRNRTVFYYFTLGSLVASYLFLLMILRAPFGEAIAGIRANEGRMRGLGYPVRRYKLASFVLAGTLAGLAGYLGAAQFGFVSPANLSWHQSGAVLITVILGGMGTLFGPVIGAFVMVLLEDVLSALTERWLLLLGGFVIAVVLLLPEGIAGLVLKVTGRKPAREEGGHR